MANVAQIIKFVNRVAEAFRPERVILFGSHAYGTPTADSDVDLLVVMPHEGRRRVRRLKSEWQFHVSSLVISWYDRLRRFENELRWTTFS